MVESNSMQISEKQMLMRTVGKGDCGQKPTAVSPSVMHCPLRILVKALYA